MYESHNLLQPITENITEWQFAELVLAMHVCSELYGNGLNGSIPETLGNLTNLISLDLWDNLLTGEIPTTLGSVSTLRYL